MSIRVVTTLLILGTLLAQRIRSSGLSYLVGAISQRYPTRTR